MKARQKKVKNVNPSMSLKFTEEQKVVAKKRSAFQRGAYEAVTGLPYWNPYSRETQQELRDHYDYGWLEGQENAKKGRELVRSLVSTWSETTRLDIVTEFFKV